MSTNVRWGSNVRQAQITTDLNLAWDETGGLDTKDVFCYVRQRWWPNDDVGVEFGISTTFEEGLERLVVLLGHRLEHRLHGCFSEPLGFSLTFLQSWCEELSFLLWAIQQLLIQYCACKAKEFLTCFLGFHWSYSPCLKTVSFKSPRQIKTTLLGYWNGRGSIGVLSAHWRAFSIFPTELCPIPIPQSQTTTNYFKREQSHFFNFYCRNLLELTWQ